MPEPTTEKSQIELLVKVCEDVVEAVEAQGERIWRLEEHVKSLYELLRQLAPRAATR